MKFLKKAQFLASTLVLLLASACGASSDKMAPLATNPLLPFPYQQVNDLDDEILIASMRSLMEVRNEPMNSRFDYTRIDLDLDGRKDALVYMKSPYGHWCGQHGCTMFVMRAGAGSFEQISEIRPVRPPMIVGRQTTNGLRDLIIRVDGRWSKTKTVALRFDGNKYPRDPETIPALRQYELIDGVQVFQ